LWPSDEEWWRASFAAARRQAPRSASEQIDALLTWNLNNSSCAGGSFPNSLIQATDGNFYGTTYAGGVANDNVFSRASMAPSGAEPSSRSPQAER
jgi:hypothetical protein